MIPKAIRDRLGISTGDEVVVEQDGREVRIRLLADDLETRRERIEALRGISAGTPGLPGFEADKRKEREREERKERGREEHLTRGSR